MKARKLILLVPIKDSDATVVSTLPDVNPANINVIYKHDGVYKRVWLNPATDQYEYHEVVDREFPYLGKPIEICDFSYDATRMGTAPTISAQNVMWSDNEGNAGDETLESLWLSRWSDCHVVLNGENFYLKQIPTSSKDNEDERYKYDIDFVSERVVLEQVYLYDVVQPFITERPISESAKFSFYGDIRELAKRINASLLRSGLASLLLRSGVSESDILTYEEWNEIGLGTYDGDKPTSKTDSGQVVYFYPYYGGDYYSYLRGEIYAIENGEFVMYGYQCKIGKDKKGQLSTSEEKLITFENNTIHEALQQFHDTFELQYYITREVDGQGTFTGNTLIMIADCEHDFADVDGNDFVRDSDGIPTTENPFDYGVDNELISKEKTNTTEKIITRITGVGSEENIPWHYPNPNPDGWIRPMYVRNNEELENMVEYPDESSSSVVYERFLKNRIGDEFVYGRLEDSFDEKKYSEDSFISGTSHKAELYYNFNVDNDENVVSRNIAQLSASCSYDSTKIASIFFKLQKRNSYGQYNNLFPDPTFGGTVNEYQLSDGIYRVKLEINFTLTGVPVPIPLVPLYYYPMQELSLPNQHWSVPHEAKCYMPAFISTLPDIRISNGGVRSSVYLTNGNYERLSKEYIQNNIHFLNPQTIDGYRIVKHSHNYNSYDDYIEEVGTVVMTNAVYLPIDIRDLWGLNDTNVCYLYDVKRVREHITIDLDDFVTRYINLGYNFLHNRWYTNNKEVTNDDFSKYGLTLTGGQVLYGDTIKFKRMKYITPQKTLMPEVYIKTDGERRFYNAVNYPLSSGTPDPMIGEEESGGQIINPIYYKEGTETHYDFENEYVQNLPREHIENFDDIKPTIKGMTNTVSGQTFRIDVVEEFAYDELDNDEIWEDNSEKGGSGEYKHPHFFAKIRPLGFNIFDLALQDDMVLSITTGHCGACNFRIAVDENTKKNPVQIWEYDVYKKNANNTYTFKYSKGSLRRYIDTTDFYYKIGDEYFDVHINTTNTVGFLVPTEYSYNQYRVADFNEDDVVNGFVGTMKNKSKIVFEGDVVTRGRFIDAQQDTSENYVWVALYKDTETYGTIMPSAKPDYGDEAYSTYIEPKGSHYYDRARGTWSTLTDEQADKFVFINIRLPQAYIRNAERELSRKIVGYMYDNNYQKFNFSIKFSRIFLADNDDVNENINENSVIYVSFNNKIYRQYVKHYTYKITNGEALPEINVDMNEELSVSRTATERQISMQTQMNNRTQARFRRDIGSMERRISKQTMGKREEALLTGTIVSRDTKTSFSKLSMLSDDHKQQISDTLVDVNVNHMKQNQLIQSVNDFNVDVSGKINQIKITVENRLLPLTSYNIDGRCETYELRKFDNNTHVFWYLESGLPQNIPQACVAEEERDGMSIISWENVDIS